MAAFSKQANSWEIVDYEGESEFKRFRIKNSTLIQTIVDHLRNWDYVVVLGAPFSEKTRLLRDVEAEIARQSGFRTLYLNLWQARSDNEQVFFSSLEQLTHNYPPYTLDAVAVPVDDEAARATVADARSFQHFITRILEKEQKHLVLFVDHLHVLPHDLVQRLLISLRSLRTELSPSTPYQIMAVVTGGFHLVNLSHGSTSPFNIAKQVIVEPLGAAESRTLAEQTLHSYGIPYTANAITTMLANAGGDHYLIPWLCAFCYDLSKGYSRPKITQSIVKQAITKLAERDELLLPIRDALQLIEEDADTLLDTLAILQSDMLPQNQARQEIVRTGVSRLQLSGAIVIRDRCYLIKNDLYRRVLKNYFTAAHVARVLRMSGRWEDAINYLANLAAGDLSEDARIDLLEAIVQSIYAADNLDQAFALMAKGLELGFNLHDVVVYRANASRQELQLVYADGDTATQSPVISLSEMNQIEAQTFINGEYSLRNRREDLQLVSALVPEKRPIGVVVVEHFYPHTTRRGLPPQLPALQRFLRYAAGAIDDVMTRAAFREIGHAVLDAGAMSENLQRVLEIVTNAVGGDIAAFYFFDADLGELIRNVIVGQDWPAEQHEPLLIAVASEEPAARCFRQAVERHGTPTLQRSHLIDRTLPEFVRVFLPLQAAESHLGVLKVGYERSRWTHFNQDDIARLHTFADQVAIAVYNMQLLQSTDDALARSVRELEKLQEISRTLTSTMNVDVVLAQIKQAIRALFPSSHVTLWELDAAQQAFSVLTTSLEDDAYAKLILNASSTAWLAADQQAACVVEQCTDHVDPITLAAIQPFALDKLVVAPMVSQGRDLGAISLYMQPHQRFDETHQALLMAIAAQAATAIEHARQFVSLQVAERKLLQSRDDDLISLSQVLLHRLGNTGDVMHHLHKIDTNGLDKSAQSALKHVEQRVLRLLDLLPSLRTVVQLEGLTFEPINLQELIDTAFGRCASCNTYKLHYDSKIKSLWVQGNWGALSDAFQSVLENGCEAMGVGRQIVIAMVLVDHERVRVQITDSGTGIPTQYHSKIFDLGFTTKSNGQHSRGRGLFTCRAILRKHRGDIDLVQTGPTGTTFEINLPCLTPTP